MAPVRSLSLAPETNEPGEVAYPVDYARKTAEKNLEDAKVELLKAELEVNKAQLKFSRIQGKVAMYQREVGELDKVKSRPQKAPAVNTVAR